MSGAASPPVLLEPIANTAPSGVDPGDKTNPLPDAPTGTNAASVQGGFPAITMESELAGGLPPLGQDMNGFLFLLSSHTMYVQCGQLYRYSSTLAAQIGGYKIGTILGMSDGTGVWLNTIDGNTSNPDTGGAGWAPMAAYGVTSVAVTGGTVNLTAAQARYPVIALTGALTSNLILNLPNRIGTWLIANGTSGNFTTTAKTASGAAGVTIPQGGFAAPTGVYCVTDGNIYPTVSPLAVPIDQAPTPLTIVERDNTGRVSGVAFIGNAGYENPSLQPVNGVMGLGPDQATLRKYRTLDMQAAMALQNFAGAVVADQVPQGAVTQYAAAILASAALTGSPTAPTAPTNTSNTRVATTAFANPGAILSNPGAFRLPSGHIVQYGTCNPNGGTVSVTLPLAYSSAASYAVVASSTGRPTQCNPQITDAQHITVSNTGGSSFWITVGF